MQRAACRSLPAHALRQEGTTRSSAASLAGPEHAARVDLALSGPLTPAHEQPGRVPKYTRVCARLGDVGDVEWRDDPEVPGRKRAWRDGQWLRSVEDETGRFEEAYLGG